MRDQVSDSIAVYILCGGRSSRMKTEKGLVEFHGKTFLQWILEAVYPLTENITLVTKNKAYLKFGLPLIPDLLENKGPVGGIYTALNNSNSDINLILSCDIPKITTEIIFELIETAFKSNCDVTILTDGVYDYPLIGCYRKSTFTDFELAIFRNNLKLCALVNSLSCQKIGIDGPKKKALQNINTKEELLKIY